MKPSEPPQSRKRATKARLVSLWLAVLTLATGSLSAATLTFSASPPAAGVNDIFNWTGALFDADNLGGSGVNANGGADNGTNNDNNTYVALGRPIQGQSFITSTNANGYDLTAFTVRVAGYSNNVAGGANNTYWNLSDYAFFRVRVGEIRDGTNFFPRSHQYAAAGGPGNPGATGSATGPGTYVTFTLDYPVHLNSNSVYGVDLVPINGSTVYFEWLGIRDGATNGNPCTNGSAYIPGTNYFDIIPLAGDRVFQAKLTPTVTPFAFAHPGALHTQADFIRMSNKVAQALQPWKADYDLLTNSPYAQTWWSAAPVQWIVRGGTGNNYTRSQEDAAAIYQLGLRWRITGNTACADRAVSILNAWANTLLGVTGDSNQSLGSGICGAQFACAAEMLSTYSGWSAADRQKFKDMMLRAFYTSNDDFLYRHHGNCSTHYRLNWDTASMTSMLAIGVLCDNEAVFRQALDYFYQGDINGNIQNALWYIHPDGLAQGEEAGRDQGHNNGGLNFLSRFCQVALNQGVDLFAYDNNRVLRGLEYLAKYNLGNDVYYVPHRTCDMNYTEDVVSSAGRGNLDPMFELLFNHYVNLKGLSAPYCKQVADLQRPEPGPDTAIHPSQVDWFGFGTLTYTRDPFVGDIPPSGVTVKLAGQQALVNWWGSAYATNYIVKRATTSGGPYTNLATISASASRMFYDANLVSGTTYYYVVSSLTSSGETANSAEVAVTTTPQLVSYLKFNEVSGTNAADSSSNNVSGTLVNGATWAPGKYGNAVSLAGASSQHVTLPVNTTTHLTDFTIATWVNLTTTATWTRLWDFGFGSPLARQYNTPTRYMFLSPQGGSGVVRFATTASGGALEQQINGTAALPTGVWKHVAVTLNGSNGVLYVDGVAVGTNSNIYVPPLALGDTTQDFLGRSQFADPYLNGKLDDFRIYNSALPPAQIAALFAAGAPANVPAAPASPTATAISASQINLTWNAAATATSYAVKRSTVSGGPYVPSVSSITSTNFTDTGLASNTTYYYVIAAANDGGQGANSTQASATTLTPPVAPASLTATTLGNSQIGLTWPASAGATGYNVKYSTLSGGPYATLAADVTATGCTNSSFGGGTLYYFVVTANSATGESANSPQATALTPPPAPAGLAALPGSKQVALSWSAARGSTSYKVKRALVSGGAYATIATLSSTLLAYVDTNVTGGSTYYYVVSATNSAGEGPISSEVSAVVRATLVAYLKFDETNGVTALDSTGNGWNGALFNATNWVAGLSNNAVNLSSNTSAYVKLPNGVVGNLTDFSISAWVLQTNVGTWSRIFDFGTGQTVNMFLTPKNGANNFVRFAITTGGGGGEQQINSTVTLPTNVWKHVAVTLNGSVGILYVDGIAVGTNGAMTLKPSSLGNTTQNYIGKSQYPDPYFDGLVDEFRIYSGALNAGEVATFITPLTAPTNLTATATSTQVVLKWNSVTRATGYSVMSSLANGGPYSLVANVTTTNYTNTGLVNGTTYYYIVTALNAVGESANSLQVTARPFSMFPPQLSCDIAGGQLRLAWPPDHLGWRMEIQTNAPGEGIGTTWITVSGSDTTNEITIPISLDEGSVFFRLVYP